MRGVCTVGLREIAAQKAAEALSHLPTMGKQNDEQCDLPLSHTIHNATTRRDSKASRLD
jgi:hypothetical protein